MPEPVRVLQAITSVHAGAAEYLVRILADLDRSRFDVAVAAAPGGSHDGELERLGVPLIAMPWDRAGSLGGMLRGLGASRRLLARGGYDVVVTHSSVAGAVVRAAGLGLGRRPALVHVVHGWASGARVSPARRAAYRLVERALAPGTDAVIACSSRVAADGVDQGLALPERISVSRYAIDLPRFDSRLEPDSAAARAALGLPAGRPLALFVGRLHPQKGLPFLLQAWHRVVAARPDAQLALCGDGPDRAEVEGLAAALPAGSVALLGWRPDAVRLLRAADLLVLPSLWEGLPLTVLEAMAAGLPVVATAVDGTPEAVGHGETGLLVPPSDPPALAEAVLATFADPQRAAAMGRAGRRRIESSFSGARLALEHGAIYARLAGRLD